MSLNTNTVNGTDPIRIESKSVNSIQQDNIPCQLPIEVIPNILINLPTTKLSELILVCKDWKAIVTDDYYFPNKMIPPPNFNGPQKWTEYTKGEVGKAPLLPRWVFKCMEKGDHMLTFIPERVKIKKEDGTELVVPINSLKNIGELFANTINGRKIGFSPKSWPAGIQAERPLEKGHWVLISKKAIGRGLNYQGQVDKANEAGANMSGLIDTVISLFMEYLRTGERHFIGDPPQNGQSTWVRVDAIKYRLYLGFVPSGLAVDTHCEDDRVEDQMAFAPAVKFFEN
jgi:F-box associated protein